MILFYNFINVTIGLSHKSKSSAVTKTQFLSISYKL